MVIGSSWVQLKRVNPRPFPTYLARESEWAKADAVLKSRNLVFERNRVDSGSYKEGNEAKPQVEGSKDVAQQKMVATINILEELVQRKFSQSSRAYSHLQL
ncbi:hypothetical protein H5410_026856 [Solanum commersonii]|uniref:Uncharacterized protein n=1 Tax=Solanum commersonii TaxID=4109 RepID=A0A9J5Z1U6_SOLCO|nr:hypothetical protein H5410_026856 [Solanum commersonii]